MAYIELQSTATGHTLILYDNAGVELDRDSDSIGADGVTFLSATMCHTGTYVSAQVTGTTVNGTVDLCVSAVNEADPNAFWASLGGDAGAVFDNFVLEKGRDLSDPSDAGCDDCTGCLVDCTSCSTGSASEVFKVVVPADIANNVCTSCADLTGTHLLSHSGTCLWSGQHDTCGIGFAVNLQVIYSGGTYRITISFTLESFSNSYISWSKDYGTTKPNCASFVDEEIPWSATFGTACSSSSQLPLLLTAL